MKTKIEYKTPEEPTYYLALDYSDGGSGDATSNDLQALERRARRLLKWEKTLHAEISNESTGEVLFSESGDFA